MDRKLKPTPLPTHAHPQVERISPYPLLKSNVRLTTLETSKNNMPYPDPTPMEYSLAVAKGPATNVSQQRLATTVVKEPAVKENDKERDRHMLRYVANARLLHPHYAQQRLHVMPRPMRNSVRFCDMVDMELQEKNEEALQELRTCIPEIGKIFDVHCRVGSGTFSSVLLGTLHRERRMPEAQRRLFAIKHHKPTNHPERILRELECMFRIGGSNNVIGINCCIRYNENVAFVMPFMNHDRFHDFYRNLSVAEVKDYLRNLLIALRHVHKFKVIHRDVKPNNILYNRRTRKFLLCDFGLAQRLADDGTLIPPSDLRGAVSLLRDFEAAQQQLLQSDCTSIQAEKKQAVVTNMLQPHIERGVRASGGGVQSTTQTQMEPTRMELAAQKTDKQRLLNRLRNVNAVVDPNNYVVSTDKTQKEVHASRAGTPGYRPPEVLLRYPRQTTAVDVWAVGVIMLSLLSSMHPFFKAPNDCCALVEIMNLFGDLQVRKTAFMLDRLVLITQKVTALDLRRVCMFFRHQSQVLSPELKRRHQRSDGATIMCRQCEQPSFNCLCKHSSHELETYDDIDIFPPHAYDLLGRLLEVNPEKRITAEDALKHPFFHEHQRVAANMPLHEIRQPAPAPAPALCHKQLHDKDSQSPCPSRRLNTYVTYSGLRETLNTSTTSHVFGVATEATTAACNV